MSAYWITAALAALDAAIFTRLLLTGGFGWVAVIVVYLANVAAYALL